MDCLSFSEFLNTFGIPVIPKGIATVMDDIPSGILIILGEAERPVLLTKNNPRATPVGEICLPSTLCNGIITVTYVHHFKKMLLVFLLLYHILLDMWIT